MHAPNKSIQDSTDIGIGTADEGSTVIKIPVPAGKKYLDIIVPGDEARGLGPSHIASVSVPWSVFVQTSVFNHPAVLYVTSRF